MDLSLFLLKNFLTAKLRKGFKSFCNGVGSTSTLNQQHQVDTIFTTVHEESVMDSYSPTPHSNSYFLDSYNKDKTSSLQPTLEEMILQLDLEEKMSMAAKSRGKLQEYDDDDDALHHVIHHRMSCVNSSDILLSARNALNQYPRFSLDGKDAMYRSSFGPMKQFMWRHNQVENRRHLLLPPKIGGHSVVWCKAGVVATLMGLEAMPVPIPPDKISNSTSNHHHVINKKQNQLSWKRSCERRGCTVMDSKSSSAGYGSTGIQFKRSSMGDGDFGSCSKNGCYIANPSIPKGVADELAGWPMRRFL